MAFTSIRLIRGAFLHFPDTMSSKHVEKVHKEYPKHAPITLTGCQPTFLSAPALNRQPARPYPDSWRRRGRQLLDCVSGGPFAVVIGGRCRGSDSTWINYPVVRVTRQDFAAAVALLGINVFALLPRPYITLPTRKHTCRDET